MELAEYKDQSARTCPDLNTVPLRVSSNELHMVLGMVTEVGELADAYKRTLAYGKSLDLTNVKEEVGDLMWYVVNFCRMTGIDMEDALGINIDKLRVRFPEKFSQEHALNRDLDAERSVLEGGNIAGRRD